MVEPPWECWQHGHRGGVGTGNRQQSDMWCPPSRGRHPHGGVRGDARRALRNACHGAEATFPCGARARAWLNRGGAAQRPRGRQRGVGMHSGQRGRRGRLTVSLHSHTRRVATWPCVRHRRTQDRRTHPVKRRVAATSVHARAFVRRAARLSASQHPHGAASCPVCGCLLRAARSESSASHCSPGPSRDASC